jgi:hypothetical protein
LPAGLLRICWCTGLLQTGDGEAVEKEISESDFNALDFEWQ